MDVLKNLTIISYDKNNNKINDSKYLDNRITSSLFEDNANYCLENIFPMPFNNIYLTNQRPLSPFIAYRKSFPLYIPISDKINIATRKNISEICYDTTEYSTFIKIVCFILNEISYFTIREPPNIFKIAFKINNENLFISCYNLMDDIYSSRTFKIYYEVNNTTILDTIIYIHNIDPITMRKLQYTDNNNGVQLIGNTIARMFDILKFGRNLIDITSDERYMSLAAKHKIDLKQKNDEIDRLNNIIAQIKEYIASIT